jgi:hypothetical protein
MPHARDCAGRVRQIITPLRKGERVSVRRLRVFEQRTGAADAVVVLRHGESSWAMALRFEHRRGSWLCTLLQVI